MRSLAAFSQSIQPLFSRRTAKATPEEVIVCGLSARLLCIELPHALSANTLRAVLYTHESAYLQRIHVCDKLGDFPFT